MFFVTGGLEDVFSSFGKKASSAVLIHALFQRLSGYGRFGRIISSLL